MSSTEALNIKTFVFNPYRENCYVAWNGDGDGVIVDPGCYDPSESERLRSYIQAEKIEVKAIWLTHGHFDHVYGVAEALKTWPVPVYMNAEDKVVVEVGAELASRSGLKAPEIGFDTVDVRDGDVLSFGKTSFKAITTPGHSPGGVCYSDETHGLIFTGDTLFAGAIGRSDLPGGDYDKLIVSVMDKVMGLPGETDVLPGHGPKSTIADERTHNPFLQPWGNPEDEDVNWDDDALEINGID